MGAWRRLGKAAACAAILCSATRSGASAVVEPFARLSLEGRYDSNALYEGKGGDKVGSISPDLELRLRDRLWKFRGAYGGDLVYYERLRPGGLWNHRGTFELEGRPTPRLELDGVLRVSWAYDPIGLAQAGIFRTGRQSALLVDARFRSEWHATRREDVAFRIAERTVIFEDGAGGAMHAPRLEVLHRVSPRLLVGGAYALGVFQTFTPTTFEITFSQGIRGRARHHLSRAFILEASAGPALWMGEEYAVVPEVSLDLLGVGRDFTGRLSVAHGLGIGPTARPGLVDFIEFSGERRRIAHRFFVRGDGGVWRSGAVPTGRDAVTGLAIAGQAGFLLTDQMRISLGATHSFRVSDPSPEFRRTTVGLRLGWESAPVR